MEDLRSMLFGNEDETTEGKVVFRKGWLSDIWTVPEDDDEPEYLVDCN